MIEGGQTNTVATVDGAAALSDLVRDCAAKGAALVDYGVAHEDLGHPPPSEHVRLVQTPAANQLDGVIEHYVADSTVRAAAGATIAALRSQLAQQHQFLPTDGDDDMTVGEVIMHNVYGPLRLGFGAARDLLLGLHYIDGEGRDIHVGGRTVKNVAGYDLTRFMVGSLGELGVVYEATLRTYAQPEHAAVAKLRIDDPARVDNLLADWLATDAAPASLEMQLIDDAWSAHVGYFGSARACNVQHRAMEALVVQSIGVEMADGDDAAAATTLEADAAARRARRAWRRTAPAVVKVIVPPATTGAVCKTLAGWAAGNGVALALQALPAHGCIFAGGQLDAPAAVELDLQILPVIAKIGGVRAWYRRPDPDAPIEPFAPRRSDESILARLKRTMDPHGIFNPGRSLPVEYARP